MRIEREYGAVVKAAGRLNELEDVQASLALNEWIVSAMRQDARLEVRIEETIREELGRVARMAKTAEEEEYITGTTTPHQLAEMIVDGVISTGPLSTLGQARLVVIELAAMVTEAREWAQHPENWGWRNQEEAHPLLIMPRWLVGDREPTPEEEERDRLLQEELDSRERLVGGPTAPYPTVEEPTQESPVIDDGSEVGAEFDPREPLMPPAICRKLSPLDGAVCTYAPDHITGHSWETPTP